GLYVYAHMHHDEVTANPTYQALSAKAKKLNVEAGEALSFITPEILSLSEAELDKLIEDPSLKEFKFTLSEMKREKAHVLSKTEEALLAQGGNLSSAPQTIFGMLNNADMKFPKIKNEDGKEVELTHGNYIQFLESPNREVRERAFKA
ncbi:oligoendopeptidase F, partial [Clostridium perfringens]